MSWYDIFTVLGLIVVIVLAVVAVVFLGRLDEIDTDDATLSVVATADGASLSGSPSTALQFVSPGNSVIMTLKTFTGTLVGASSFLSTQTPISDEFWPPFDLTFPIVVQNNSTQYLGYMTVLATGIITFKRDLPTIGMFELGTVTVYSTGVSWTVDF
jgi:hypothetical protein